MLELNVCFLNILFKLLDTSISELEAKIKTLKNKLCIPKKIIPKNLYLNGYRIVKLENVIFLYPT